jgi:hypothetical protein
MMNDPDRSCYSSELANRLYRWQLDFIVSSDVIEIPTVRRVDV